MAITLNKKTKATLQSGIDKLGLEGARKKLQDAGALSGLQEQFKEQAKVGATTGIKPVASISSPVAKTGPTGTDLSGLDQAKGYDASQVGIEGVNLFKKPPVVGSTDTTAPVDTTLPGTDGTGATGIEGTPGTPGTTGFSDLNKDGVINENELTGDYKTFFDTLSNTEKKLFLATGENAMKKNLDITEVYANYMRDYNTVKGRKEEDEAYRLRQQELQGEAYDIQDGQTLRRAVDGVNKLKQSIAYLGDLGMPGKSSQRAVSIDNQVTEAKTSLNELRKLQSLAKSSRALGEFKKAADYERQMEDITTKLNDDIDKSIQDAFNTLIEADNNGKLDTVEELTSFRDKMYADLDMSITGFSDASIGQMKWLSGEINNARSEAITYQQNTGAINPDMSMVNGYYTDMNGAPMISGTTGQRIPMQAEPPMAPIFDKGTGRLISFYTDESGAIKTNIDQVIDEPTFTEQTVNDYVNLVAQGKLAFDDLPENVKNNPSFLSAYSQAKVSTTTDGAWKQMEDGRLLNSKTGEIKDSATGEITGQDVYGIDFSSNTELINKYPNEASFKNNNPTGITFQGMSDELKSMFDNAGVQYSIGTARPTAEGGNYVKFASVQDGLDAYTIALTQRGDDVKNRLSTWVGTTDEANNEKYAKDLMDQAGIPEGTKFSQLNEQQLGALMDVQLQRESPNYYNELANIPAPTPEAEQASQTAQDWGQNILRGKAKLSDIAGNPELKDEVSSYIANNTVKLTANDPIIKGLTEDKTIAEFLADPENVDLAEDVSGIRQFSPWDSLTGKKQQYLRKVQFILDGQTLQNLIDIKAAGGTFGALSEKELGILQTSASLLNAGAERDKEGNVTGFTMSEPDFKKAVSDLSKSYETSIKAMTGETGGATETETQPMEEGDKSVKDLANKYFPGGEEADEELYKKYY